MTPTLLKCVLEIRIIFPFNMKTQKTKRNNFSLKQAKKGTSCLLFFKMWPKEIYVKMHIWIKMLVKLQILGPFSRPDSGLEFGYFKKHFYQSIVAFQCFFCTAK